MLYLIAAVACVASLSSAIQVNGLVYNVSKPGISAGDHYGQVQILPVNMAVRGTHRRMVEVYDKCKNNGSLNIADAFMDMTLFFNLNCDNMFMQEGAVVNYYNFATHNGETLSSMITATYAPQVTPARIIITFDGQVAEGDLAGGMYSKLQTFDTRQILSECQKEPGMQKIEVIHEEITIETPNGKVTCTSGKGDGFFNFKPGLMFANGLKKQTYKRRR